jgi:multidrug efflux pump subunit AcrA (membrane-fusion protein)
MKQFLLIGMVLGAGLAACSETNEPSVPEVGSDLAAASPAKFLSVRVVELAREPVLESRVFVGTTRAVNRAIMRSQIAGRVASLPVTLGKKVQPGDVLLELYNPEANPAAQSAERQWRRLESQQSHLQPDFDPNS